MTDSEFLKAHADKLSEPMISGVFMPFDTIAAKIQFITNLRRIADDHETTRKIVIDLADWSLKYPRGPVYPMSQKKMDDELRDIEERAKQFSKL